MPTNTLHHPNGYEQEAVNTSSASALSPPDKSSRAVIQADGCDVRWRDDGTDPTTSQGMILRDGYDMLFEGSLNDIRLIAVSGSGAVNVMYYR